VQGLSPESPVGGHAVSEETAWRIAVGVMVLALVVTLVIILAGK
jgi:uncharacterized membrane protein (DUF485 family)